MSQYDPVLEQLKQKYQSVLNLMQQLQVQLQNVNMEGSRLMIRGVAPSADVKNKVWDQIKLVDRSYSDLICDLTVAEQRQAPVTMTAGAAVSGGQSGRRYRVKPGDSFQNKP